MTNKGYFYAIGSFVIWGVFPIYWKLLEHFDPIELTAYRIIWSFLTLLFFLVLKVEVLPTARVFLEKKTFFHHFLSTIFIGINWFLFIYAVNNNQILQASFGYFLGPLFSVMIGLFFLREQVDRIKVIAILMMLIAIITRAFSLDGMPWLSLILGLSFALYGLMRKFMTTSSVQSITYETFLLFIPSLLIIFYFEGNNQGHYLTANLFEHILLMLSGIITITPLILFSAGAKRIPLNTLGFIQYLAPALQLSCAVFIYDEKVSVNQAFSFIMILAACSLLIYNARFSKASHST